MKTAVIYARYSSDRQTEQSIEGQVRVCNDYAERNDILIVNQYVDRATTGTNDNRDAFQQVCRPSHNGYKRQPRRLSADDERQRQEGLGLCAGLQIGQVLP